MLLFALAVCISGVLAEVKRFSNTSGMVCTGMYARADWDGPVEPYIELSFEEAEQDVLAVVFEYKDYGYLGVTVDGSKVKQYVCNDLAVEQGVCTASELGRYIVDGAGRSIMTTRLAKPGKALPYHVNATGYYCVMTNLTGGYSGEVEFRNAFGHLSAVEAPDMPFYRVLGALWALCATVYGWMMYRHRGQILPLQKCVLAYIGLCTAETAFRWGFLRAVNHLDRLPGLIVYLTLWGVMSGVRYTATFLILGVTAEGWGVVYPVLSQTSIRLHGLLAGTMMWVILGTIVAEHVKATRCVRAFAVILSLVQMVWYFRIGLLSLKNVLQLVKTKQVQKIRLYRTLSAVISAPIVVFCVGWLFVVFVAFKLPLKEATHQDWMFEAPLIDQFTPTLRFIVTTALMYVLRPSLTTLLHAALMEVPEMNKDSEMAVVGVDGGADEEAVPLVDTLKST